jgi:hypothetical protein
MLNRTITVGDSVSVCIPQEIAEALGFTPGSQLNLEVVGHTLIITQVAGYATPGAKHPESLRCPWQPSSLAKPLLRRMVSHENALVTRLSNRNISYLLQVSNNTN